MPGTLKVKVGGQWVEVGGPGPAGPAGPPGPEGPPGSGTPGAVAFRHVQTVSDNIWTITHSLGFYPNVTVVDSTGREIWPATVDYLNATTVALTFSAAVGGEAYLS